MYVKFGFVGNAIKLIQGVPQYVANFVFVIFRVLEHIQRNFWPLFYSPGNLLHDSHRILKIELEINVGTRQLEIDILLLQRVKKIILFLKGLDLNYLYFWIKLKNFCGYHVGHFQSC